MPATSRTRRPPITDPPAVRTTLIIVASVLVAGLIVAPIAIVVRGALAGGASHFLHAITDRETLAALRLSGIVVGTATLVNIAFGLAAAWAIARFHFPGRTTLITLIDLPFAVSPVISGLVFVLLFGARSPLGAWLAAHHIRILFAAPGIVLATVFVTFPYIARELIPAFESLGPASEEAALVSGANGWQVFTRVALPSVRSALVSGIALAVARAAGEFGAVAVVSGHIAGRTNTLPLYIASLYDSGDSSAALAIASLLLVLTLITLAVRRATDQ
jgi:sulfate/thiosulfate transport system permease protein